MDTIPEGYTTVTPWMISKNTAGLIDFLKRAFGAEELARVENPNGPASGMRRSASGMRW